MRTSARILLGFFTILLLLFVLGKNNVFAQTFKPNTYPNVPNNLHTFTQSTTIEILSSFLCQITGVDPLNPQGRCLGVDFKTGKIGYINEDQSVIGGMSSLISMTFTPPTQTGDYVRYLSSNFGVVKSAYAQTTSGVESLHPLTKIWIVFRDFAYILFTFVFIVIGLLIMLRVKIDPRTVMTIQNQIPRLIIGIVLVTFSFAISGFLIDVMWISIFLILSLFASVPELNLEAPKMAQNLHTDPFNFLTNLFSNNAAKGLHDIVWAGTKSIFDIVSRLIEGALGGGGTGWIAGKVFGGIAGLVGSLIITIAILVGLFRLWFMLLQAYIMILINIVLAPFWIMGSAIPGRSVGFGAWLKSMLAHISAFPATIFLFLMGASFIELLGKGEGNYFLPPLIGGASDPKALSGLIGIAVILLTPNVVNYTKQAFKAPKTDTSTPMKMLGAGGAIASKTAKESAASTFAFWKGSYPNPEERKLGALARRMFR